MELISPTDFAKEKVQSVQEYAMLAARSIGNLFKRPLYLADMIQQADRVLHRWRARAEQRRYPAEIRFADPDWTISIPRHGARVGSGHHWINGCRS